MRANTNSIPWLRIGVESTAIIVSILLAFGIDAWYAGVIDSRAAREYEQRLSVELQGVRRDLEGLSRMVNRALAYASEVEPYFESETGQVEPDQLILALYNMGRDTSDPFDVTTYQELVSSGRLGLIADTEQRAAVQRAYASLSWMDQLRNPYQEVYALSVRALIPERLVAQIRDVETCRSMSALEWDCSAIDLDDATVNLVIPRLSTEEAYLAFRARMQGLAAARRVADIVAGEIEEAISYFP